MVVMKTNLLWIEHTNFNSLQQKINSWPEDTSSSCLTMMRYHQLHCHNHILEFNRVVRSPHFGDFNFRAYPLSVDVDVKLCASCHDKKDDEMI